MSADFDAVTLTEDFSDNQQEFDMTNNTGATVHVDYQKGDEGQLDIELEFSSTKDESGSENWHPLTKHNQATGLLEKLLHNMNATGKARIEIPNSLREDKLRVGFKADSIPAGSPPVQAWLDIQSLKYTANAPGVLGNNISIEYAVPPPGSPLNIIPTGPESFQIQFETDGGGVPTPNNTAAAIQALVMGSPAAAILTVSIIGAPPDIQTAPVAPTNLHDGADPTPPGTGGEVTAYVVKNALVTP